MKTITRRRFVQTTTVSAAGSVLSPGPVWGLNPKAVGANERVRVAMIGCGERGNQLTDCMPDGCQIIATADAYLPRAKKLADRLTGDIPAFADYRELIDRVGLDGVMIASTGHHHVLPAMLACQAGMDVYIEKPMSNDFAEGRALVNAARHYDRVVQVGTQQRTMEFDRFACELIRDGGIGEVKVVECVNYGSSKPYPKDGLPEQPIPKGLDWDAWLGCAPFRPYNQRLRVRDDGEKGAWQAWREYHVGGIGGMGAHAYDMVQYALGMDDTGPVELWPNGVDEAGILRIDFRYANGVEVRLRYSSKRPYRGPRLGGVFVGSKCKMEINRNKFVTNPVDFVKDPPPAELAAQWEGDGHVARGHIQNWLDAIKTRTRPNADVEIGHRTSTVYHLIGITRELNRRLRWDPVAERFPDDAEANALLQLPRRQGWELPSLS
ncbi:putative oxidoreductase YcjS [Crateriforma conspicua]|uniref:Putative oxidoreductase YcjS n=1 Tax=Crateriforma conspicua TaxID=2527996 RepID=A0A5C6FTS0_9PLAN|nr:Gfo/Idh/MocA family oxidoreductase [Crateriforma conspicua]TWU64593.1 putative oxidoreductase YcjS [Crateriforma conspicua]